MHDKILILAAMILGHILADYNLQGWLASAKQRKDWKENAPKKMYQLAFLNTVIHMYVDDEKANKETINLVEVQIIHLIQIFLTWGILIL